MHDIESGECGQPEGVEKGLTGPALCRCPLG